MSNRNLTILLDGEMKQLAIVKESAKDVRHLLKEARAKAVASDIWVELTGANGREFHMRDDVWRSIAVVNEIIVVDQETPKSEKILVPQAPFGN